jgi:hypothetical protein
MPCTPDAIRTFLEAGVTFAPGKAANGGGVATSAYANAGTLGALSVAARDAVARSLAISADPTASGATRRGVGAAPTRAARRYLPGHQTPDPTAFRRGRRSRTGRCTRATRRSASRQTPPTIRPRPTPSRRRRRPPERRTAGACERAVTWHNHGSVPPAGHGGLSSCAADVACTSRRRPAEGSVPRLRSRAQPMACRRTRADALPESRIEGGRHGRAGC